MPERLGLTASVAYIRDAVGDDREPYTLTILEIVAAVQRRDGNLDLAAADLRDLLQSRTGSDFGAAWAKRTDQLREKGFAHFGFGEYWESSAQYGDVADERPSTPLEPAEPPDLILVCALRVHNPHPAVASLLREGDFLNEPRTDHLAIFPEVPSYETGDSTRRFLGVALTYVPSQVTTVDENGNDFIPPGKNPALWDGHVLVDEWETGPSNNLSFTRNGRDFRIFHTRGRGTPTLDYFGSQVLRFHPPGTAG